MAARRVAGQLSRVIFPAIYSRKDQNIPINTLHTHHWINTGPHQVTCNAAWRAVLSSWQRYAGGGKIHSRVAGPLTCRNNGRAGKRLTSINVKGQLDAVTLKCEYGVDWSDAGGGGKKRRSTRHSPVGTKLSYGGLTGTSSLDLEIRPGRYSDRTLERSSTDELEVGSYRWRSRYGRHYGTARR